MCFSISTFCHFAFESLVEKLENVILLKTRMQYGISLSDDVLVKWAREARQARWLPGMWTSMNEDYGQFMVSIMKLTICVLVLFTELFLVYSFRNLDALDSMNNKKAIQQADKILRKQKDLHCAKVNIA